MLKRNIGSKIKKYAEQYPVVTLTGPRQSGKTTLSRMLFPEKSYISLEDLDNRTFAQKDPRGFLVQFPEGAIIDEVQYAPDLFSYIQTDIDQQECFGKFILTGSQQFELMEKINQSLAGRTAIAHLLPFSYDEVYGSHSDVSLNEVMYKGFYPRIHDHKLNPAEALSFYVSTYIERDVRKILNIVDLSQFEMFIKLCAGRTGQLINLQNLGNDCGVSHNTIKSWLSVLEASYIIKLLKPWHANIKKRLVKSPKLYFLDVGLAAHLLSIDKPGQILAHPLRGALFETMIISEFLKKRYNQGQRDNLYFFRDHQGNEVDLVLEYAEGFNSIEIKSSQTITSDFFNGLKVFSKIEPRNKQRSIVYGGNRSFVQEDTNIFSWNELPEISSS